MLYYICLTTTISLSLIDNNELYIQIQYEISRNCYTLNIIYADLLVIFFILYRDKETQDVWIY